MASQQNLRLGIHASPWRRWAVLRVVMAIAIALLAVPLLGSSAYAGEPGVCDTNKGTGKVDAFLQNTEPDGSGDWANGNMNGAKADFAEGDVVPQRVDMSALQPGENELAFAYDVWVKDKNVIKYAYDYVTEGTFTNGVTLTRWYVENADGPTATVYVTFDVPAGVTTTSLYYGAHIASELDHGPGSGAGSIQGSPYHGGMVSLNCAKSGANANQIAASAIDAGELTIVKAADPADGTDFHFSITPGGDASTFALDVDGDPTLPDRLTYRVAPGTYAIEELDIPAGWNLADITCSKATSGSTATSRSVAIVDDEQVTCTFSNSKIRYKDLTVTNTATPSYDRDYDWTIDKSLVGAPTRRIADGQSATVDYDVTVTPSAPKDSKLQVSGDITVANPNNVAVTGVTVNPSIVPGATCTVYDAGSQVTGPVTVPAGGMSLTYTCAMGPGTGSTTKGTSTVSLSWPTDVNYGTSGVATATKDFDFGTVTPRTTDASVTVTDDHADLSTSTGGNVVRAADGARTFTYPVTWPGEAGVCKSYPNTATITEPDQDRQSDGASVEVCEGKDLTVSKTVVDGYSRSYDWSLSKVVVGPTTKEVGPGGTATFDYKVTATGGKASDSTWAMSGAIKVSNPNAWPVTLTDITDQVDVGGGAACTVDKGTDLVIAAGSTRSFDYSCSFTSQPKYDGTNTATATWSPTALVSPHTSASGTAAVTSANWTTAELDKTVTVIDDKTDPAHPVALGQATWAGAGVSTDFTYTGPALAGKPGQCVDYTNNAWIRELPEEKASAKVSVCESADITVAKKLSATYDTTYLWNITKAADRASAEVGPGGTATFNYTVVAEPTRAEDGNWNLAGTISLRNPNTFKAVTVSLTDAYTGGGVCTPEVTSVDLPAGGSVDVTYSCNFGSTKPAYSGTDTVTASWDGGTAQAAGTVTFQQAGTTDYQVPVYDDLAQPGGTPKLLGLATWDAPEADRTFRNSLDLGAAAGQCVDYTNTAWVDTTAGDQALLGSAVLPGLDPAAQATVTVCAKADLTLTNKAGATYDTTYLWAVSKDAASSYAEVAPGGTARFDYTVVAEPVDSRDSGWTMSGTVALTNPNQWQAVTATLSAGYSGGGVCTPDQTTVEVPAAGSVEVGYSCDFGSTPPTYSGTSTVTASFGGHTVEASTPVTFTRAGKTDYEVPVYDDLTHPGGTPKLLGTATWDAPEADRTFTNSLDLGAAPGQCIDHINTAWADVTSQQDPSAQKTVTVCEQGALSVIKDARATYDTTYDWDVTKSVDQKSAEIAAGGKQDFGYTVTALPKRSVDSNWSLTGTITVSNPNVFETVDATLDDVYDNGTTDTADDVTCTVTYPGGLDHLVVPKATTSGGTVTPGQASATYACDFAEKPAYSGDNHVTVHWGNGQSDSYDKPVVFQQDKTVDRTVTVYDDKVDLQKPAVLGQATWAWDDQKDQGVPTSFHYTLTQEGVAGRCTDYTNHASVELTQPGVTNPEASATATLCVENPLDVTRTATASFDRSYHWRIDKSVDNTSVEVTDNGGATFDYTVDATPQGSTDSGYTMGGTVTVTNPNTYTGGDITAAVTDVTSVGGGATCTVAGGDSVTLAPGEARTLDYACSFTSQPAYDGTDTATATWTGPGQESLSSSTKDEPVSFSLGQETDRTVTVTDDMTSPSVLGQATWNADGTPEVFHYSLTHGGTQNRCVDYTNTASIRETEQSDSTTVTVCDQGALVVTKTAEATYDRTYDWDITKVADRTRLELGEGETGTVNYVVAVTPKGYVDSGWTMNGSVSVSNPNDYKDVTVALSDVPALGGGAACTFDGTQDLVVTAGGTRTFGYSCSFTQQPSYDGSDTVNVEWAGGHVAATSTVPFTVDRTANQTVTITDDRVTPGTLGQATWDQSGRTTQFSYALGFQGRAGACQPVTNTATIVETGEDARATVDVCYDEILPVDQPRQPSPKPRPPLVILPETGAPRGMAIWTTLGGLMVATGAALLIRRRRNAS